LGVNVLIHWKMRRNRSESVVTFVALLSIYLSRLWHIWNKSLAKAN